ncbi:MAG: ATP-binding cassette domain-containing protein [Candidatus Aminicenantes bacterium]|nr:ATP-binding cassette domain-containing protein [Candidatus Aminicenantes bacterium]
MIELKGVFKNFGHTVALRYIDLVIKKEETAILIGPSGCGKSTLLRLIVGLIQPEWGMISIDGHPVQPENLLQLRHRMGYVIQQGGLFPHLTAEQNMTIMARYLSWEKERIINRIHMLAELTRFPKDRLNCYPIELSGGQQQRVSLMRALMLDPDILLFDEPLAALDPMIRSELQQDLKRIFRFLKKTVIWVTHDMGEASYFGGRIILLKDGCILQSGSLTTLVRSPTDPFVTRFINAQRSPLDILLKDSP